MQDIALKSSKVLTGLAWLGLSWGDVWGLGVEEERLM
jgi:hypothetical protein